MCRSCIERNSRYDEAWQTLSRYLHAHWRDITVRGSFDLTKVFAGDAPARAIETQLFFVLRLAERLRAEGIAIDLESFSGALHQGTAHPEVTLLVANALVSSGRLRLHDSGVSVLRSGDEVQSALWTHLAHPVAIKVCYLRTGAPVRAPDGFPWHPSRQRKIVKISPYEGDTQPTVARRDLRI